MGMSHTFYVNKRAVLGQGISFQELNSLLETIEDTKIVEWNAHQGNWYKEIKTIKEEGVTTVIIPSVWALTAPEQFPEDVLKILNSGKIQICYFNKKLDAPNYSFPSLSIPSDRGSLVLEAMVNMVGDSSDRGLHSLFPEGTEVLAHQNITGMETLSFDLEQLFKEFQKKVKKLMLHKVKVSIALKSLIRWVYDSEPTRPEKMVINLGFANNLFGFSCRWKTNLPGLDSLVKENTSFKGIASSTSALWFNFFPQKNEIEAFGLISFAMDAHNSFPQITNAYSLGLKVFPEKGVEINKQIKSFSVSHSTNLVIKKYVDSSDGDINGFSSTPEAVEVKTGIGHGIYIVKSSISGHGVTFKDLNSIIESSAGVKVQSWDATQEDWMAKAVSLVGSDIVTLFIPSFWLLEASAGTDQFLKYVMEGKLRISCLQKKGEPPFYKFPIFMVPSDRGSLILEGIVPLIGQSHYSGIHAIFPVNTEIFSMAKTSPLDRASKDLDKLYGQLMKKARKLMLHKTKVAVCAKTILYSISVLEGVLPKTVDMQMGYKSNLFSLSFKWKTSLNSVLDWSKEIPQWKKICSTSSGSWFNFFPGSGEIEAVIIYSFAIDCENSVPAIDNAFSLGVDIFPPSRLVGKDKVAEKETLEDIKISKTTERALPSNFDEKVVDLYFKEEETFIEEAPLEDVNEVVEEELEEVEELTQKVHTILYIKKVFDNFTFDENQLTDILVKSATYNEVRFWDVQQVNWLSELGRMKTHGICTVLVPPIWLMELPQPLPGNFEKRVLRGDLRIVSFNKKQDPPNPFIPGLFVPMDRNRNVFKTFLTLFARPFYCGIHSVFPSGHKVYKVEIDLDEKNQIKEGLESLFNMLQKEGHNLKDFKLKINLAIKSVLNIAKKESKKEKRMAQIQMGIFDNILAFSIKWPTNFLTPAPWIQDNISWKNIASTSSAFWFNFLPDSKEIEALSLYILDDLSNSSCPSMANAYPLAFEIFNDFRKDKSFRLEEQDIDGEKACKLLLGFYLPEGENLDGEDVFFDDEELDVGDSFSSGAPQVSSEEVVIGSSEVSNGGVSVGADELVIGGDELVVGETFDQGRPGEKSGNSLQKSPLSQGRNEGKKVNKKATKKAKNSRDFSISLNKNKSEQIKPEHTYMGNNPLSILLAVKDKASADRFSSMFNEEKVKIFSTSHSHQAVKFLQNQKFHCLITHMDIAKGHGENIVKEVRGDRNNQNYRIPIIVVLNDYDTKGLLTRVQPLINQILDEDVRGAEVYSSFAMLCHPYFLPKKRP